MLSQIDNALCYATNMFRWVAIATLLLGIIVMPGSAQTDVEKIIEKEKRAVNLVAGRFSTRLIQQKDIGLLIDEFFVSGFVKRSLKDKPESWMIFIEKDLANSRNERDLRRYFIAQNNWIYLNLLYH